ncbi:MAG TPA: TauD/TfdA family dioxygenase [Stellaceae bacterium]|nr:TauD/TfdA family dioxygenase [Stellaceae bacterium]
MTLKIRPLHESFGAEIIGVDIARDLDDDALAEIEAAWYRHSILLFRGVEMTPAQHIAFSRRLGPLHIMEPPEFNLPDHPEVLVVSNVVKDNVPLGIKRAGWGWHSDGEDKARPNAGSFLYAMKLPPADGDTLYADTYAAFAALPDDIRRTIMGRRACFSRARFHQIYYPDLPSLTEAQKRARPDVWHPIARRHPHSGWTSLYIGRWAYKIEGMPDDEADALVRYVQEFATRPEYVYRHKWRVGDALLWDNRCVQHCATPFDDTKYERHMQRTTLEGEVPLMAETPVLRPVKVTA